MISFINSFLSYLIVVIVFFAVIICAALTGKKLRENKDKKTAMADSANNESSEGDNK